MTPDEKAELRAYAETVVAGCPPLNSTQRHRLSVLLRPAQPTTDREASTRGHRGKAA